MSRGLRGFSRSMEGVWVSEVVFAGARHDRAGVQAGR